MIIFKQNLPPQSKTLCLNVCFSAKKVLARKRLEQESKTFNLLLLQKLEEDILHLWFTWIIMDKLFHLGNWGTVYHSIWSKVKIEAFNNNNDNNNKQNIVSEHKNVPTLLPQQKVCVDGFKLWKITKKWRTWRQCGSRLGTAVEMRLDTWSYVKLFLIHCKVNLLYSILSSFRS